MLYVVAVFFHSWMRWVVLALAATTLGRAIVGIARGRRWTAMDQRIGRLFVAAFDTQVAVGLLLYFVLSPLTPRSLADLHADMPVATLRFFAIEHGTMMISALVVLHVGWVGARRAPTDAVRYKRLALGVALALAIVAIAIPWPMLPYGRPLARLP